MKQSPSETFVGLNRQPPQKLTKKQNDQKQGKYPRQNRRYGCHWQREKKKRKTSK